MRKENGMNIFEIIGPVMVGPSSSHTAGAVRIGFVARNLLGEEVKKRRYCYMDRFWLPEEDMVQTVHW